VSLLDRLRRLRLFRRAADLERDLRSLCDVGMPTLLSEAKRELDARMKEANRSLEETNGRLVPLEDFQKTTAYCIRCGGVFAVRAMRLFHMPPPRVNGGPKPVPDPRRALPSCVWCAEYLKRGGKVGKEFTAEELNAPAPATTPATEGA